MIWTLGSMYYQRIGEGGDGCAGSKEAGGVWRSESIGYVRMGPARGKECLMVPLARSVRPKTGCESENGGCWRNGSGRCAVG